MSYVADFKESHVNFGFLQMLTSKDTNFVGYTFKNSDVFKGMMNSPIGTKPH